MRGGGSGAAGKEGGSFIENMPGEYLVLSVLAGWAVVIVGAKKIFGGSKE